MSRNGAGIDRRATVLALVVGRRERARLVEAFRGRADVRDVQTVVTLEALVVAAGTALVAVIVEPRDAEGAPVLPFVRWCLGYAPAVPVVAYCEPGADATRDIIELSRAGVHELLFRDVSDEPSRIRTVVDAGLRASAATRTLTLFLPHVPPSLHGLVEYCVYHPGVATSVDAVAVGLGLHRKTLVNYCARDGLPPPGFMLGWSRVLHATVLLSTTRRPVDHIARALSFPSGTALRNMIRRYVGLRPSELRDPGAPERVVTRFLGTVRSSPRGSGERAARPDSVST